MKNITIANEINRYSQLIDSRYNNFSEEDNKILLSLLKNSEDQFDSNNIIETIGQISWNRRMVENYVVKEVVEFLKHPEGKGFGSFAAAAAVSWGFGQWYNAGHDEFKNNKQLFIEILKGASWDEGINNYDAQPVAISVAVNYYKSSKDDEILTALKMIKETSENMLKITPENDYPKWRLYKYRNRDSTKAIEEINKL